mmetsp:Transcript_8285/g.15666  ORF Transcript_8285/g.15666 Transcript_8285/m.15666 type:complete len:643 (+) Transcript_8285:133-2061(+)
MECDSADETISMAGRAALLTFIKSVANGELTCERHRQTLCESSDFVPREAFQLLHGSPPKGHAGVRDVHKWILQQPHWQRRDSPLQNENDVAEFVQPFCSFGAGLRELCYEGFLKMVLPRTNLGLRDLALSRDATGGPRTHGRQYMHNGGHVSGQTCHCMCVLFEEEVALAKELRTHRKILQQLRVTPHGAFRFLSKATLSMDTATPGSQIVLSSEELRLLLTNRLGELSNPQSDAFFRRVSNHCSDGLITDDLVQFLHTASATERNHHGRPHHLGLLDRHVATPGGVAKDLHKSICFPRMLDLHPLSLEVLAPQPFDASSRPVSTSRQRAATPRATPRLHLRTSAERVDSLELKAVMQLIERQGQLDNRVQKAKAAVPTEVPLELLFQALGAGRKGNVTGTDLWCFSQQVTSGLAYPSTEALIRELQNARRHDNHSTSGKLSFREVAVLVRPCGSLEHDVLDDATTDDEARSALHVLRHSQACPGCGARVQRQVDRIFADCPTVTCPICNTSFDCPLSVNDNIPDVGSGGMEGKTLPDTVRQSLCNVIEAYAGAADEIEILRKHLVLTPSDRLIPDAFEAISCSKDSFTFVELTRALNQCHHWPSGRELQLIWHRYARGNGHVIISEFTRQLLPVQGRVPG